MAPKINIIFLQYQNVFFVNVKRFFFNFYFDPSALNSKMWHYKLDLLPQFFKFIYNLSQFIWRQKTLSTDLNKQSIFIKDSCIQNL